jgi:hypothetical protein
MRAEDRNAEAVWAGRTGASLVVILKINRHATRDKVWAGRTGASLVVIAKKNALCLPITIRDQSQQILGIGPQRFARTSR